MAEFAEVMRVAAATLACVLALAACSAEQRAPSAVPLTNASADAAFVELVTKQLAEAQDANADPAQISLLEEARDAGVMSHELAMESARNFIDCLASVDIRAELEPSDVAGDFPKIDYRIYSDDLAVADECRTKTYDFVDTVYQLQPATNAPGDAMLAKYADEIIACLKTAGADIPDDVDVALIPGAALSVSIGMQPFSDDALPNGPVDCLAPLGLDLDDIT